MNFVTGVILAATVKICDRTQLVEAAAGGVEILEQSEPWKRKWENSSWEKFRNYIYLNFWVLIIL